MEISPYSIHLKATQQAADRQRQEQDEDLCQEIKELLLKTVPGAMFLVRVQCSPLGGDNYISIKIAASADEINRVKGQFPGVVSLWLDCKTLELRPQVFGGNGGQHIFVKPPAGSHLAQESIKIPFRTPKKELKNVLAAIERFATRWKTTIRENLDRMPQYESSVGGGFTVDWGEASK